VRVSLIVDLVLLLALANGAPIVATRLMGGRLARPVDGGARWFDGRPIFGASKTIRGLVVAVAATALAAAVVGLGWRLGAMVGGLAMAGDLCSSFLKRRMGLPPASRATGLDQVPESLLPLIGCAEVFALTAGEIAAVVAVFFGAEIVGSRILYRLHIRKRPY
jgi:CDP-2,3-bis-(O-geranylgeranyl)-sn-glycerol synthase